MPNALTAGGLPPAPPQDGSGGNGLQPPGVPPAAAPANAAPPAPPTHEQTVAALRHFDAVKGELTTLLSDPATGKSDQKSKIIDGVAKLVAERMISPGQAVIELWQVPRDPLAQRKWLVTMMQQTVQAENGILDHYGQGNPSLAASPAEVGRHPGNRDDHMEHLAALAANYSGTPR